MLGNSGRLAQAFQDSLLFAFSNLVSRFSMKASISYFKSVPSFVDLGHVPACAGYSSEKRLALIWPSETAISARISLDEPANDWPVILSGATKRSPEIDSAPSVLCGRHLQVMDSGNPVETRQLEIALEVES